MVMHKGCRRVSCTVLRKKSNCFPLNPFKCINTVFTATFTFGRFPPTPASRATRLPIDWPGRCTTPASRARALRVFATSHKAGRDGRSGPNILTRVSPPLPHPRRGLSRASRSSLLRLHVSCYRTAERIHLRTGEGSPSCANCTDDETLITFSSSALPSQKSARPYAAPASWASLPPAKRTFPGPPRVSLLMLSWCSWTSSNVGTL